VDEQQPSGLMNTQQKVRTKQHWTNNGTSQHSLETGLKNTKVCVKKSNSSLCLFYSSLHLKFCWITDDEHSESERLFPSSFHPVRSKLPHLSPPQTSQTLSLRHVPPAHEARNQWRITQSVLK
jgi:hypothetical protein